MIEIQELNVIRRGPHWQLEVVIDFDVIPGVPESVRIPVPVQWHDFDPEKVMDDIEERVQRAVKVLREELKPGLEQIKMEFSKRGRKDLDVKHDS